MGAPICELRGMRLVLLFLVSDWVTGTANLGEEVLKPTKNGRMRSPVTCR